MGAPIWLLVVYQLLFIWRAARPSAIAEDIFRPTENNRWFLTRTKAILDVDEALAATKN